MSAYICSDAHFNYLANFAIRKPKYGGSLRDGQNVIDVLYSQNLRSVNHRYREDGRAPAPRFKREIQNFDMVQVIKACHCLAYESCETDDYENTEAKKLLDALEAVRELPGYESAQWGCPADGKAVAS